MSKKKFIVLIFCGSLIFALSMLLVACSNGKSLKNFWKQDESSSEIIEESSSEIIEEESISNENKLTFNDGYTLSFDDTINLNFYNSEWINSSKEQLLFDNNNQFNWYFTYDKWSSDVYKGNYYMYQGAEAYEMLDRYIQLNNSITYTIDDVKSDFNFTSFLAKDYSAQGTEDNFIFMLQDLTYVKLENKEIDLDKNGHYGAYFGYILDNGDAFVLFNCKTSKKYEFVKKQYVLDYSYPDELVTHIKENFGNNPNVTYIEESWVRENITDCITINGDYIYEDNNIIQLLTLPFYNPGFRTFQWCIDTSSSDSNDTINGTYNVFYGQEAFNFIDKITNINSKKIKTDFINGPIIQNSYDIQISDEYTEDNFVVISITSENNINTIYFGWLCQNNEILSLYNIDTLEHFAWIKVEVADKYNDKLEPYSEPVELN